MFVILLLVQHRRGVSVGAQNRWLLGPLGLGGAEALLERSLWVGVRPAHLRGVARCLLSHIRLCPLWDVMHDAAIYKLILILCKAASLHRQITQAVRHRLPVQLSLSLGVVGHLVSDEVVLLLVLDALGTLMQHDVVARMMISVIGCMIT